MSGTANQVSLDTLLSFIAKHTVEHFKTTGRRTNGAMLAEAIRGEFPGLSYEQIQLRRLSDAVRLAEQRGLVLRHRDVKHLELSPGPSSGLPLGSQVPPITVAPLPYVKPDVWRAFVFVSSGNHLFLDRETGQVVTTPDTDVSGRRSLEANSRFARIVPIPASVQQGWMREFIEQSADLNVDDAPICDDQWWVTFPAWLRSVRPDFERDWNRFRTRKVFEHLQQWSSEHSVLLERLLSPREMARQTVVPRRMGARGEEPISDAEALRTAILHAVREMPLEQLEGIAIPVRYILRHFKPR